MPIYRVETSHGTFDIDADREPTEAEVNQYVSSQAKPEQASYNDASANYEKAKASGDTKAMMSAYDAMTSAPDAPDQPTGGDYLKAAFGGGSQQARDDVKAAEAIDRGVAGGTAEATAVGTGAGIGQTIGGSFGGAPGRVLGGALGAGGADTAAQVIAMMRGKQDQFKTGQLLGNMAGGAIPGGTSVKGGVVAMAKEGVKQGAGNVAAKSIQTVVDEGRLPTAGEAGVAGGIGAVVGAAAQKMQAGSPDAQAAVVADMKRNGPKYEAVDAARRLNISIKPSEVNPDSSINRSLETLAGRGALTNELKIRNQEFADAAARRHAGLGKDAPLTPESLDAARDPLKAPYAKVEAISDAANTEMAALKKEKFTDGDYHGLEIQMADPDTVAKLGPLATQAAADVKELNSVRSHAAGLHRQNAAQYNYDVAVKAGELDGQAEVLENRIAEAAKAAGTPELLDELKAARQGYAKTYDVERSLNQLTGHINPQKVGAIAQKSPGKLTGELADLAKVQKNFPDSLGTGRSIQDPGVSGTNMLPVAGAAIAGDSVSLAKRMAVAGIPLMRTPARKILASSPYQRIMAQPAGPQISPDVMAAILREAAKAKARQ